LFRFYVLQISYWPTDFYAKYAKTHASGKVVPFGGSDD